MTLIWCPKIYFICTYAMIQRISLTTSLSHHQISQNAETVTASKLYGHSWDWWNHIMYHILWYMDMNKRSYRDIWNSYHTITPRIPPQHSQSWIPLYLHFSLCPSANDVQTLDGWIRPGVNPLPVVSRPKGWAVALVLYGWLHGSWNMTRFFYHLFFLENIKLQRWIYEKITYPA